MKTFKDYIHVDIWFAWFPVKTNDGWSWFRYVGREVDMCLLPIKTYKKLKTVAKYNEMRKNES